MATAMSMSALTSRTAIQSRRSPAMKPFVPQRTMRAPQIVRHGLIGEVNDPEKVKDEKERKAKEGQWAEPHNNNKLEDTHGLREGGDNAGVLDGLAEGLARGVSAVTPGGGAGDAGSDAGKEVKKAGKEAEKGAKNVGEQIGDAVKKVTGQ